MAEVTNISDSEKLDVLNKRLKRIQSSTDIQTGLMILAFLGLVSLASLVNEVKKTIK